MIKNAKKITIIGGSGTGKTTLAENLAEELGLPLCHIDGIHHLANWKIRDQEERDKIILEKVSEPQWIMDGTYHSTLKQRLESADLVIYLDYSSVAQVKGAVGRFLKHPGKEKREIPGCKEELTWDFLWWVWNWRKYKRDEIIENLEKIENDKVLIFKNRRQLNKWYKQEFDKKIICRN